MTSDWIEIAEIDDIPLRGARTLELKDVPIAVFRTSNDEIFALIDRCPHRGGPLSEGIVSGKTVACPLHNWVIELDSGRACAPDTGCAPALTVKLAGRRILLCVKALAEVSKTHRGRQERAA